LVSPLSGVSGLRAQFGTKTANSGEQINEVWLGKWRKTAQEINELSLFLLLIIFVMEAMLANFLVSSRHFVRWTSFHFSSDKPLYTELTFLIIKVRLIPLSSFYKKRGKWTAETYS
jgi:hypothetical protein